MPGFIPMAVSILLTSLSLSDGDLAQPGEYVPDFTDRQSVEAVILDIPKPNGIVGTEDGRVLYLASTETRKIYRYDINVDGSLSNRSEFADQGSDGMTLDEHGNVYLTGSVASALQSCRRANRVH